MTAVTGTNVRISVNSLLGLCEANADDVNVAPPPRTRYVPKWAGLHQRGAGISVNVPQRNKYHVVAIATFTGTN